MRLITNDRVRAVLPDNLRLARRKSGDTQAVFAARLGLKQCTYAKYEEGLAQPSIATCLAICQLGKLSLDDFVTKRIR